MKEITVAEKWIDPDTFETHGRLRKFCLTEEEYAQYQDSMRKQQFDLKRQTWLKKEILDGE